MFEKSFRKPKAEKGSNREQLERIAELGRGVLEREAGLKINPERSGGYMLCTILAMALAMGMAAGKAEAQEKRIGPQGRGLWGQMAGDIFREGVFEAGSAIDRSQNAARDRIEQEYVVQLTKLEDAEGRLDHQYAVQKSRLGRKGTAGELETLEKNYKGEKARMAQARIELEREYKKQTRNTGIKKAIIGGIFQGIRGW
jgi:hypothetical protein